MKKYDYVVKTFRHDGKQYKVYGKTLEEALSKRLELKSRLKNEEIKKNTITVSEWLETALSEYKPNVSDDYMYQMEHRIEKHITAEIGDIPLQKATPLIGWSRSRKSCSWVPDPGSLPGIQKAGRIRRTHTGAPPIGSGVT